MMLLKLFSVFFTMWFGVMAIMVGAGMYEPNRVEIVIWLLIITVFWFFDTLRAFENDSRKERY